METSWSRLGAAAAFDAAFDAAAAASKLSWWLEASCSRLGGVLDPLEGLLEASWSVLGVLERLRSVKTRLRASQGRLRMS